MSAALGVAIAVPGAAEASFFLALEWAKPWFEVLLIMKAPWATAPDRLNYIKWVMRAFRNAAFDLRYGAFLGGSIKSRHGHLGAYDTANSDYNALDYMFKGRIGKDVLVDVGCGKGRVINWWQSHGYRNRIIGIELDERLAEKTRRRLKRYENVTIISGNVLDNFPEDGTLFYFYNPFDSSVMERFRRLLVHILSRKNQRITIIYYNLEWLTTFKDDPAWAVAEFEIGKSSWLDPKFHRFAVIRFVNPTVTGREREWLPMCE